MEDETPTGLYPTCLGHWSRLTQYPLDKDAVFTFGSLLCVINHFPTKAPAVGDYVVTFPRRDGLFEHIYRMSTP